MSKLLPFDAIIEIVSEEHEIAVRKRAYEMGYTKGNVISSEGKPALAWRLHKTNRKQYCVELTVKGIQEYSSKEFYDTDHGCKNHKRITLTDLYRDYSTDDKSELVKEIEAIEKKMDEEIAKLKEKYGVGK